VDEERLKEQKRQAQAAAEIERTKAAHRADDEVLERTRLAEAAQLAFKARQDRIVGEKQEALERGQDQLRHVAKQRCEVVTLRRTDAGTALTEAHAHEDEVRRRRLVATRKVARATAAFEEARRFREAAEKREQAAQRVLDSAAGDLDRADTAAEWGRSATQDALTRLHIAQQDEFESQVGFIPFDNAEVPLGLNDLASDDPPQQTTHEKFEEPILVKDDAPLPSHDALLSDTDRLAESIRKVEEMRQQEELERQAKVDAKENERKQAEERARSESAAKLRHAKEERERVMREARERKKQERIAREQELEERERLAREQVVRERAAELEEQQRISRWKKASSKEAQRCRTRDRGLCASKSTFWPVWLALQRFQAVYEEFDRIHFSERQPLVFESIPWPVLHRPDSLKVSTIDWSSVKFFFRQIRPQLQTPVYKDLAEKTQQRFHPDRWRSRGILATVFDGDMREQIREAGNVVSQAITPIWRESQNL
jgi:hypothetical protein